MTYFHTGVEGLKEIPKSTANNNRVKYGKKNEKGLFAETTNF